jgi:hypothetical protein
MLLNTTALSDNDTTLNTSMPASPLTTAKPIKAKPAKRAAAKKAVSKKPAVKPAAKKAVAKKVAVPKESKPIIVKPAAKPAAKKKAKAVKAPNSAIFLEKDDYKALIAGLMDQGIEHGDAVDTIKVGLRQANGIPVPMTLTMSAG